MQAGFTKGGRVEDNLLILQYCEERAFKMKRSLIASALDISKAFDSVKRGKLIDTLLSYNVDKNIIQSVVQLYDEDKTMIYSGEDRNNIEMEVTSGIKQECTCSTSLFKLSIYNIIEDLEQKGQGIRYLTFNILVLILRMTVSSCPLQ